jgi:threonine/homoserine/homoserine lactone efflux protein
VRFLKKMDLPLPVRGFLLGLSIAAVLGPIGLLCVRRTLVSGFAVGFVSGLGAATADAGYAAIAGFGVSAVATLLVDERVWLRVVGGAFLVYLGVQTMRASPAQRSAEGGATRLVAAYTSTLALTFSNPMTILSFAAVFAGIGLGSASAASPDAALTLVLGVFIGSATWWFVLASVTSRLRDRFTTSRLRAVNLASGLLILVFGVQSLVSAF